MKILEEYAGALTNFEVLDFLRSKVDGKDPKTRLIPSEHKVYDYLEQTAASTQTRDIVNEFVKECKSYDLAPAEILNIINIMPASEVEVYTMVEDCENRSGIDTEKLVETVVRLFPAPPTEMEPDDGGTAANEEETAVKDHNEVTA